MQVSVYDNYKQKIQEAEQGLEKYLKLLKYSKQRDEKVRKRLHRRIKYWYDRLTDLKYRAAPYSV